MQVGLILLTLIGIIVHTTSHKIVADKLQMCLGNLVLWGGLINLVLLSYLPLCISMFVSLIGLRWEDLSSKDFFNNMCVVVMLYSWVFMPAILFIRLYHSRNEIGELEPGA